MIQFAQQLIPSLCLYPHISKPIHVLLSSKLWKTYVNTDSIISLITYLLENNTLLSCEIALVLLTNVSEYMAPDNERSDLILPFYEALCTLSLSSPNNMRYYIVSRLHSCPKFKHPALCCIELLENLFPVSFKLFLYCHTKDIINYIPHYLHEFKYYLDEYKSALSTASLANMATFYADILFNESIKDFEDLQQKTILLIKFIYCLRSLGTSTDVAIKIHNSIRNINLINIIRKAILELYHRGKNYTLCNLLMVAYFDYSSTLPLHYSPDNAVNIIIQLLSIISRNHGLAYQYVLLYLAKLFNELNNGKSKTIIIGIFSTIYQTINNMSLYNYIEFIALNYASNSKHYILPNDFQLNIDNSTTEQIVSITCYSLPCTYHTLISYAKAASKVVSKPFCIDSIRLLYIIIHWLYVYIQSFKTYHQQIYKVINLLSTNLNNLNSQINNTTFQIKINESSTIQSDLTQENICNSTLQYEYLFKTINLNKVIMMQIFDLCDCIVRNTLKSYLYTNPLALGVHIFNNLNLLFIYIYPVDLLIQLNIVLNYLVCHCDQLIDFLNKKYNIVEILDIVYTWKGIDQAKMDYVCQLCITYVKLNTILIFERNIISPPMDDLNMTKLSDELDTSSGALKRLLLNIHILSMYTASINIDINMIIKFICSISRQENTSTMALFYYIAGINLMQQGPLLSLISWLTIASILLKLNLTLKWIKHWLYIGVIIAILNFDVSLIDIKMVIYTIDTTDLHLYIDFVIHFISIVLSKVDANMFSLIDTLINELGHLIREDNVLNIFFNIIEEILIQVKLYPLKDSNDLASKIILNSNAKMKKWISINKRAVHPFNIELNSIKIDNFICSQCISNKISYSMIKFNKQISSIFDLNIQVTRDIETLQRSSESKFSIFITHQSINYILNLLNKTKYTENKSTDKVILYNDGNNSDKINKYKDSIAKHILLSKYFLIYTADISLSINQIELSIKYALNYYSNVTGWRLIASTVIIFICSKDINIKYKKKLISISKSIPTNAWAYFTGLIFNHMKYTNEGIEQDWLLDVYIRIKEVYPSLTFHSFLNKSNSLYQVINSSNNKLQDILRVPSYNIDLDTSSICMIYSKRISESKWLITLSNGIHINCTLMNINKVFIDASSYNTCSMEYLSMASPLHTSTVSFFSYDINDKYIVALSHKNDAMFELDELTAVLKRKLPFANEFTMMECIKLYCTSEYNWIMQRKQLINGIAHNFKTILNYEKGIMSQNKALIPSAFNMTYNPTKDIQFTSCITYIMIPRQDASNLLIHYHIGKSMSNICANTPNMECEITQYYIDQGIMVHLLKENALKILHFDSQFQECELTTFYNLLPLKPRTNQVSQHIKYLPEKYSK